MSGKFHSFPIFDQIKLAWSPIKEQAPIKEMAPIEEMATLLFRAKSIPAMAFEQAQPWLLRAKAICMRNMCAARNGSNGSRARKIKKCIILLRMRPPIEEPLKNTASY